MRSCLAERRGHGTGLPSRLDAGRRRSIEDRAPRPSCTDARRNTRRPGVPSAPRRLPACLPRRSSIRQTCQRPVQRGQPTAHPPWGSTAIHRTTHRLAHGGLSISSGREGRHSGRRDVPTARERRKAQSIPEQARRALARHIRDGSIVVHDIYGAYHTTRRAQASTPQWRRPAVLILDRGWLIFSSAPEYPRGPVARG